MKNLVNPFFVHDVSEPARELLKSDGHWKASFMGEGQPLSEPKPMSWQNVSPKNIGFVVDISKLRRDGRPLGWFCEDIGRRLAENEIEVLKDGLVKGGANKIKVATEGIITRADITNAVSHVSANEYYPDRLMLSPKHKWELAKENPFYMMMLASATKEWPSHYAGQIDGLDVYWNAGLKGLALAFESFEATFARTELAFTVDNQPNPTRLKIICWCSSAPVDGKSVAVVEI